MVNTLENAYNFMVQDDGKSKSMPELLFAYANSVRTEVVVPSEAWINGFKEDGRVASTMTIEKLKSLNPSLTFTELNHEK